MGLPPRHHSLDLRRGSPGQRKNKDGPLGFLGIDPSGQRLPCAEADSQGAEPSQ